MPGRDPGRGPLQPHGGHLLVWWRGDSGGTSAVTLSGGGNVIFNNANTYKGATAVNAGILQLGSTGGLGNTAISVASGATFAPGPVGGQHAAGPLSGVGGRSR